MPIVYNTIWVRYNIKNSVLVSYQTEGAFHKYKPQELWYTSFNPLTL